MKDIQEANWDKQGPDDQGRNSHLGLSYTTSFCFIVSVDFVRELCSEERGGDESETEAEIGKAGCSNPEPISMSEDI